ncbi:MAG TPA: MnmC family methyltransferase [Verrucomicrobiae bacterium]|nr:MnmC family methyltransferase [Verrucomicrobiae bacterium]
MSNPTGYRIVKLPCGAHSVHSLAHGETFHPVVGPVVEAEALYVKQLRLRERLAQHEGEFVIWDVGLGAAANAVTVLRHTQDLACSLRLVSFDHTLEPLEFALRNTEHLSYLVGSEELLESLLREHHARVSTGAQTVNWDLHLADFPSLLASPRAAALPKPHAIMFDAFSPATNPVMWTQPLFANICRLLEPARPCALPTYSRSTMLRVTLLLAGFFVGRGHATGEKEETTIAANTLGLLAEPLDGGWLQRARRSSSAEPMWEPLYRQAPLSEHTWEKLQAHPQFQ